MSYNFSKTKKTLRKYLDRDRFEHSEGVMYTAAALAMRYGEDLEKAQIAGILHDCAKCMPILQRQNMISRIQRFWMQSHVIPQASRR